MAITKLQANWTNVEFASTPITMVTSVAIDQGKTVNTFKADADVFDVVAATLTARPTASITSGDEGMLMGLSGTGVLTAQHNDALKVTAGAVLYTITTAIHENSRASGDHAAFGSTVATFKTFSSDGTTNPVAITRV